ncbi:lytic transglycosylase domain-containing protein [Spirosoma sp. KCTC 42546]|uniref:lytic transglycosylase domain-containing protein n=1 Tax=Spirosoma sp. KCTC 42546 TaxID=2520506 RepID=UPI001156D17E|nr:lytic transglycosylase domain-containing protein [Spirosoma sp. KCTC 42546]QDK82704.1 lytic transglycosylase domain-containing protein [Spirosoma sp. KCTC 42546]
MNLLASLSLATGLMVASVSDLAGLLHKPADRSLPIHTATALVTDPGLTRLLPPVYFCGESVPLHEEAVARRLVSALAQNTNQNRIFYRIRQRASVFFPIIEPILARHGIPLDFKYLPLVESALTGLAVSPKGAVGYWQFMPATARELGLSIRPGYDERQSLVKSTNAACRYLNYLYNRLGSWTLAAAAYNNGIGALLGNIRRQQQRDYYYLRLNAETGKYLYRILAFKELFSNYRSYQGFIPERMMAYLSEPLTPDAEPDKDEVLLPEVIMNEATKVAVNAPSTETAQPTAGRTLDIPLPNAGDVFRGGIKARLVESAGVERGQVWVFHLTRDGMADGKEVEEGDVLYAIVEDVDKKTDKIYLRADRLYSASEKHTYTMNLSAIDASTGRIGIKLPDVDQIKAGWILTWKTL